MEMSRLTKLPLRTIWKHEALDFTQWLALPENLELLAETLGIGIINAQTEVPVGQFNLDILAEDDNGEKVIIENQLETTDHDHLGKVITYASGLNAKTCVWIVARARQEHEQAINWLNENTTEDANFFLLEIEAWKIGDSAPAPRFNIVAKPNDWAKTVKQSGSGSKVSDLKLHQQAFWEKMREYGEQNSKHVRSWQKPLPQHWYNISIGTSKANLAASVNTRDKLVAIELYINNDKDLFHALFANKDKIESELGYELNWQELPGKKGSRIIYARSGDVMNEDEIPALVEWLTQAADIYSKVFRKYL
ncbi:MAG TPA: DUF4268 domain-containing protein [Candidatus Saccharibacteria bacterium]|mgnify:CR=1 FL=1|nr:DUF4268 domain-containing protein [Candidatus Saccharibacteria bacterium]